MIFDPTHVSEDAVRQAIETANQEMASDDEAASDAGLLLGQREQKNSEEGG